MSDKSKFQLEFSINCSPKVLYNRLATPAGLSEWFADDVNVKNGDIFVFIWDGAEQEAKLVAKKDQKYAKFQWLDEDDDSFFEFRIAIDDLTGDLALIITDFAEEDEKEDSMNLWETQVGELKHVLGS